MTLWLLSPLHKASRQITVHLETVCAGVGVGVAEGHLLTYLASYGPCPIAELARVFGHSPSTLTGMLDRLEGSGLVVRAANPGDRRSFLIEVTPAGRAAATALRTELERLEAEVAGRVTPVEQAGFGAVMRAVEETTRVVLREARSTTDGQAERVDS